MSYSLPVRALRLVPTEIAASSFSWGTVVESINSLRDVPVKFNYYRDSSANKNCVAWLKSHQVLLDWVKSPYCLRSPPSWPKSVLPAFQYRLIPTPFDLFNVDTTGKIPNKGHEYGQYLKTVLYCMGFTVSQIADFVGESEKDVERDMYNTIEAFFEMPEFVIWATATNFKKSLLPPYFSELSIKEKADVIKRVKKNPFLLGLKEARRFLESPRYLTYLVYGSPKKPRITKHCRLYHTKEG
tara:strand:+ start:794 stop:1516 length:723 start_codon:yes stop_codon:yes gene_type:complete